MVPHVKPTSRPVTPTPRVLCVGLATVDIIQSVDALPAANQKVVAREFLIASGGPAANGAVAVARCGAAVDLVTALPDHPLSGAVVQDLAACAVEVTIAGQYNGPPVTATISVTHGTGERAVVSPTSAAGSITVTRTLPRVDTYASVLMDGYFPTLGLPLAREARQRGIPVILDAGSFKLHTDDAVRTADCVVASADFSPPGTGGSPEEVFAFLAAAGVPYAAITRGADSVLYRTPSGAGEVPVPAVAVVDTLGAGDFFHGALAAIVAREGLDEASFARQLAQASAVAGESLGTFGTRAWLTTPARAR